MVLPSNNNHDPEEMLIWELALLTDDHGNNMIVLQEANEENPRMVCLAIPLNHGKHWTICLAAQPHTFTGWTDVIRRYRTILDSGKDYASETESFIHLFNKEPIPNETIVATIRYAMNEMTIAQNVFDDVTC